MHNALAIRRQTEDSDERALIASARADPAAFGTLYERHVDRIYAYLRTRTRSPEDAADLTQHAFLQALRSLPRYRARSLPFAAWLFRIARNASINFHRDRRTTVAWEFLPEALQPPAAAQRAANGVEQEDDVEAAERQRRQRLVQRRVG